MRDRQKNYAMRYVIGRPPCVLVLLRANLPHQEQAVWDVNSGWSVEDDVRAGRLARSGPF